ncbi:hypothetical protein KAFR_0B00730 [Kazachstania africana CBS 2517]|uniref:PH domain-containing protein n=1 Tax=Kazachstania africana (strain ATCC 22294 / BCRC 22015 / CBS 2517 / CECT 1963 / NBRC 1671 / NRRL Y-8276) TaxID=1071382 RepID=H2APS2_KAZAF|nr:hypothetical protein KAFR_0B00730 [Kazachstania africana CBS 2517]CCF56372.1 hypothetical protein KAFR_0B00730 [Kazachstania africana CBS 2517]
MAELANDISHVDEVMSDLVKEIETEMERTITHTPVQKRQLDLLEIGEETMDMIVDHNTRRNETVAICSLQVNECKNKENRKSVIFSDDTVEIKEDIVEDNELHVSNSSLDMIDLQDDDDREVKEYSLQDYDLSSNSLALEDLEIINESQDTTVEETQSLINLEIDGDESDSSTLRTPQLPLLPGLEDKLKIMTDYIEEKQEEIIEKSLNNNIFLNDSSSESDYDEFALLSTIYKDEDIETLNESTSIKSFDPIKPSNYLAIWHKQDAQPSPAMSITSRFSSSTAIESPQLAQRDKRSSFTFKPRIISRSKIHYPKARVTSSSSAEEELQITIPDPDIPALFGANVPVKDTIVVKTETKKNAEDETPSYKKNVDTFSSLFDFDNDELFPSLIENNLGFVLNEIDHSSFLNFSENSSFFEKAADKSLQPILLESRPPDILVEDVTELAVGESSLLDVEDIDFSESSLFGSFQAREVESTPTKAFKLGLHSHSPFKVVNKDEYIKDDVESSPLKLPIVKIEEQRESQEEKEETNSSTCESKEVSLPQALNAPSEIDVPVTHSPKSGRLFLALEGIENLALKAIRHHKAKYSIEFDLDGKIESTPWEEMSDKGSIDVKKDFSIVLERNSPSLKVTLKCKYQNPEKELVEIVEKVPVGKRFPFQRTKYVYRKKYIQRNAKADEWATLFDQDGSYAQSMIDFDPKMVSDCKFKKKSVDIPMFNKWTEGHSVYKVGTLKFNLCFFEKTSSDEVIPNSYGKGQKIAENFRLQQSIFKEGYLLQKGGDLQSAIRRRYFRLQGTELVGYHEVTKASDISINLLKVEKVMSAEATRSEGDRVFTNLTELVLFGESINLVFKDGEIINLTVEGNDEDRNDWYKKLCQVVDLNITHQPWVKKYVEAQKFSNA